jgi:hypothetical protein
MLFTRIVFAFVQPPRIDDFGAWLWWLSLSTASIYNCYKLSKFWDEASARKLLGLGPATVFTIVCAFRSFIPRIDAERMCFFPGAMSWPFWGRSGNFVVAVFQPATSRDEPNKL